MDDVGCGMPLSPLDCTYGVTTSGVACPHGPWATHTIGRHLGPSSLLGSKHGKTMPSITCYYRPWSAHTVGRREVLQDRIAFGQHTESDKVKRGMPSSPLNNTQDQIRLGMSWHYSSRKANMVGRCWVWHVIIVLGYHTRSYDIWCRMP